MFSERGMAEEQAFLAAVVEELRGDGCHRSVNSGKSTGGGSMRCRFEHANPIHRSTIICR